MWLENPIAIYPYTQYKLSEASVCIFMAQSTVASLTVLEAMQPIPTAWKFKKKLSKQESLNHFRPNEVHFRDN